MLQVTVSRIEVDAALQARIEEVLTYATDRGNWYDPDKAVSVPGDDPAHVVWAWPYRCVFSITLAREEGVGAPLYAGLVEESCTKREEDGAIPCRLMTISLSNGFHPTSTEKDQLLRLFHFGVERTRQGLNEEPGGQVVFIAWEPYLANVEKLTGT